MILNEESIKIENASDALNKILDKKIGVKLSEILKNIINTKDEEKLDMVYSLLKKMFDNFSELNDKQKVLAIQIFAKNYTGKNNFLNALILYVKNCSKDWIKKDEPSKKFLDNWNNFNFEEYCNYLKEEISKHGKKKTSNAKKLYDDGNFQLWIPLNYEGEVEIAKYGGPDGMKTNCNWCTRRPEYYNTYTHNNRTPLYIIKDLKSQKAWQLATVKDGKEVLSFLNQDDEKDSTSSGKDLNRLPNELLKKVRLFHINSEHKETLYDYLRNHEEDDRIKKDYLAKNNIKTVNFKKKENNETLDSISVITNKDSDEGKYKEKKISEDIMLRIYNNKGKNNIAIEDEISYAIEDWANKIINKELAKNKTITKDFEDKIKSSKIIIIGKIYLISDPDTYVLIVKNNKGFDYLFSPNSVKNKKANILLHKYLDIIKSKRKIRKESKSFRNNYNLKELASFFKSRLNMLDKNNKAAVIKIEGKFSKVFPDTFLMSIIKYYRDKEDYCYGLKINVDIRLENLKIQTLVGTENKIEYMIPEELEKIEDNSAIVKRNLNNIINADKEYRDEFSEIDAVVDEIKDENKNLDKELESYLSSSIEWKKLIIKTLRKDYKNSEMYEDKILRGFAIILESFK